MRDEAFKPFSLTTGLPSLSVTKNGVSFNRAAIVKMEKAPFVALYIDDKGKRLAIQKSDDQSQTNVAKFYRSGGKNFTVRWNNSDLLKTIEKITGWNLEMNGYKIEGEFDAEEMVMIFDFNKANMIK